MILKKTLFVTFLFNLINEVNSDQGLTKKHTLNILEGTKRYQDLMPVLHTFLWCSLSGPPSPLYTELHVLLGPKLCLGPGSEISYKIKSESAFFTICRIWIFIEENSLKKDL